MSKYVELIIQKNRNLYTNEEWLDVTEGKEIVTRCRDCKHSTEEGITTECYFCHLPRWNTNPIDASPVEPNGFCAWGERMES